MEHDAVPSRPCSHDWIDPSDPPIARASYAPFIGPLRREMKRGRTYRCRNCGMTLHIPAESMRGSSHSNERTSEEPPA